MGDDAIAALPTRGAIEDITVLRGTFYCNLHERGRRENASLAFWQSNGTVVGAIRFLPIEKRTSMLTRVEFASLVRNLCFYVCFLDTYIVGYWCPAIIEHGVPRVASFRDHCPYLSTSLSLSVSRSLCFPLSHLAFC